MSVTPAPSTGLHGWWRGRGVVLPVLALEAYAFLEWLPVQNLHDPEQRGLIGSLFRILAYYPVGIALAAFASGSWHNLGLLRAPAQRMAGPIAVHLLSAASLVVVTDHLFNAGVAITGPGLVAWPLFLFLWIASGLLVAAPASAWRAYGASERHSLILAAAFAVLVRGAGLAAKALWDSWSTLTLDAVWHVARRVFPTLLFEPATQTIGTPAFTVIIEPSCSGYEGIALASSFTAFYLVAFRENLRWPRALVLLPLAVLASWMLNIVRIVALIAVGTWISPDVAIFGFHSRAGWIAFFLVTIGVIVLARRPLFSTAEESKVAKPTARWSPDRDQARILPFVVLLAATLLTGAFSAGFDALYPVRVIATSLALWFCWRQIALSKVPVRPWAALGTGVAAFGAWIALAKPDEPHGLATAAGLAALGPLAAIGWCLFRVLGGALTVPLVEELVFRGVLFEQVARWCRPLGHPRLVLGASLAITSVAFGALHGALLAATACGVLYGLLRIRTGSTADPVLAHAVTNLLLTGQVLATGQFAWW